MSGQPSFLCLHFLHVIGGKNEQLRVDDVQVILPAEFLLGLHEYSLQTTLNYKPRTGNNSHIHYYK